MSYGWTVRKKSRSRTRYKSFQPIDNIPNICIVKTLLRKT